jgi:hypothetical protein
VILGNKEKNDLSYGEFEYAKQKGRRKKPLVWAEKKDGWI